MKPSPRLPGTLAAALLLLPATSAPAAETKLNGHTFTLPDGFTIEQAAGSSLIPRPIAGSFDRQGRLYVTDSSGSNKPPAEQLKDPQSRILRLEDTDGDGVFDRSSVFAEHVMFPQGCLWHDGSVYVAGPPSIWKFTDSDGDGVADRREEWYQGQVLTGCANDVHGPYLGPEGMLYWTKGAFSRLDLKDGRGQPINDRCAHVFRSRSDGSGMEVVLSGGMDNPVEVAFTAEGEPIVISTFIDLSQPGRRDGLGHAVYGGVFGKINDVVDEPMVRRTGDLLPVLTHFGPAAACALMRYEGKAFGADYQDNLFGTLFNLRKVTRHVLSPQGATYAAKDSDFLVSDQIDFRPTDVLEDADGSLLVVDTGGWYKLCCPSSQLAKADVLGAIYRVRRSGAPNLAAADRAAAYAALNQPPGLAPDSESAQLKRAVLAAKPESAPRFREILRRDTATATTDTPAAQRLRLAAEGLGRLGDRSAIPALFAAIGAAGSKDRFLEHSLIYALIEIGAASECRPFLGSQDASIRRAALLALEQIGPGGSLETSDIAPLLNSTVAPLRDAAQWIAKRHPDWGGKLAGFFRTRLTAPEASADEKSSWESLLPLLARQTDGQSFLAEIATGPTFRPQSRGAALAAMAASGVKTLPPGWSAAVLASLSTTAEPTTTATALRALRALPFPKEGTPEITAALHKLAGTRDAALLARIEALASLPSGSTLADQEFISIRTALEPGHSAGDRLAAANAVGRLKLSVDQLRLLTPLLGSAGPLELPRLLAAYAGHQDAEVGRQLLAALEKSKALKSVRPDDLKPHLAKFPSSVQDAVDVLLAANRSDASEDQARLDAMLGEIQKLDGQIRRGQNIFNSTKAACSTCHRLGYLGGDLGPDLTSIGQIRTERDLLEAVVFPNASFVRSYEPWIAATKDGEEYSGVLRRDTPEEIVLATGPGAESHVRRGDMTELRLGTVSIMPTGMDEQLSRQDLADLIAFLKNTKWGVN